VSSAPSVDAARSVVESTVSFRDLALSAEVLAALDAVGYESPSPIQAQAIPPLLAGSDLVGQAQTGTGKTAAFALPILSRLDLTQSLPQALVLVPTRELAIQVAEAFQRYAAQLRGFRVLPVYGGQSYTPQLTSLRRGVHVIVGTPGRMMDHMKRGTLDLSALKYLVLDEADEMLRMGFIDDVEWILKQTPESRQIALFSATMPAEIRRIAKEHLHDAAEVTIRSATGTVSLTRQRFCVVSGIAQKLEALTRILEAEPFDAMIVFARTKQATTELAERLEARGFAAEALNGDIPQAQRERTIARLRGGQVDIVVATDVAARGIDVERVSHVVNFDVPYDPESYVHRVGRTGRAGRSGEAILFIAPRERNMLRVIERTTRQQIELMQLPSLADVNVRRVARFHARITETLASPQVAQYRELIASYEAEHNVPAIDIAAALALMAQGKKPLLLDSGSESASAHAESRRRTPSSDEAPRYRSDDTRPRREAAVEEVGQERAPREHAPRDHAPLEYAPREKRERRTESTDTRRTETLRVEPRDTSRAESDDARAPSKREERRPEHDGEEFETFRIEVGLVHGVKPANIVGAIANEANIEGRFIGRVVIRDDHSFVDLPAGMPKEMFRNLQKIRVAGQRLDISRALRAHVEKLQRERGAPSRGGPRSASSRGGPSRGAPSRGGPSRGAPARGAPPRGRRQTTR
jgi:ATP-dependent RNA helicase DeaD